MDLDPFASKLRNQALRCVPPEWRQEILHAAKAASGHSSGPEEVAALAWVGFVAMLRSRLTALLWPAPKAWAALAVVWLALLLVNHELSPRGASPSPAIRSAPSISAWLERERLLTELLEPAGPPVAARPRPGLGSPRSEAQRQFLTI